MLGRLLKFVIRTRFTRPFLILIVVVLLYSSVISQVTPPSAEAQIIGYYGTAIIALFLGMAMATGGVMVLKSDRDYLFTLPLSQRDLSLSIFISQFIAFGITILFMFTYLLESVSSVYLVVNLVALATTFTSIGIIAPSLTTRVRILSAAGLALWTLLAFTGFPISPAAAFEGNPVSGTATVVVLGVVTTVAAFRSLSRVELDMMRNLVRTTASDVKSPNSYVGKSPIGAIYSMNLSTMSIAGRMNMAGTSRYVSRRVKTRWVVLVTSAAATVYFATIVLRGPPAPFVAGTNSLPEAILSAVLLGLLAFFFSQSAIVNERVWLSLTSLTPARYFKHLVASKLASFLLVLVPFALADTALLYLGYGEALGALAVVTLVIPAAYVLEILWTGYLVPIQVKGDDQTMAAQFSVRQLLTVLPLIPLLLLSALATLEPTYAMVGGVVLLVLAGVITLSGRFWAKVLVRMTESGFV
ncbi:MAG TPA: hypothetical protein VEB67_02835 [Nitrososphaerales archaeon]|nr:hypothetical protein [Nitrososphaerales archaeon]